MFQSYTILIDMITNADYPTVRVNKVACVDR